MIYLNSISSIELVNVSSPGYLFQVSNMLNLVLRVVYKKNDYNTSLTLRLRVSISTAQESGVEDFSDV